MPTRTETDSSTPIYIPVGQARGDLATLAEVTGRPARQIMQLATNYALERAAADLAEADGASIADYLPTRRPRNKTGPAAAQPRLMVRLNDDWGDALTGLRALTSKATDGAPPVPLIAAAAFNQWVDEVGVTGIARELGQVSTWPTPPWVAA